MNDTLQILANHLICQREYGMTQHATSIPNV